MVYRTKRRVAKRARKYTGKKMYRSKTRTKKYTADRSYSEKIVVSVPLRLADDNSDLAYANIMWNPVDGVHSDSFTHQFTDISSQFA